MYVYCYIIIIFIFKYYNLSYYNICEDCLQYIFFYINIQCLILIYSSTVNNTLYKAYYKTFKKYFTYY